MASDHSEQSEHSEPTGGRPSTRRPDASVWNWLLVVPIVVPLLTLIYNRDSPHFLGFPAFYWLQLLFVLLGVTCTTVVYQTTKRRH